MAGRRALRALLSGGETTVTARRLARGRNVEFLLALPWPSTARRTSSRWPATPTVDGLRGHRRRSSPGHLARACWASALATASTPTTATASGAGDVPSPARRSPTSMISVPCWWPAGQAEHSTEGRAGSRIDPSGRYLRHDLRAFFGLTDDAGAQPPGVVAVGGPSFHAAAPGSAPESACVRVLLLAAFFRGRRGRDGVRGPAPGRLSGQFPEIRRMARRHHGANICVLGVTASPGRWRPTRAADPGREIASAG